MNDAKIEIIALKIRNLIAFREFNTAMANRDVSCGDGWICDYAQTDAQLDCEITKLMDQLETLVHGKD